MGKNENMGIEEVIIFVVLAFAWFNILPLFYSAMLGETRAFLSFLLAIITYFLVGKKAAKILK